MAKRSQRTQTNYDPESKTITTREHIVESHTSLTLTAVAAVVGYFVGVWAISKENKAKNDQDQDN